MPGSKTEARQRKHLGPYVTRVMAAKGLSARDVAVNSGNRITAGYVTGIMKGTSANPSVDKLSALAVGLDVNLYELFDVACGFSDQGPRRSSGSERLRALEVLELMRKVVVSPVLMAMIETGAQLPTKELEIMLAALERIADANWRSPAKSKQRQS
jgi:hypothetical protein